MQFYGTVSGLRGKIKEKEIKHELYKENLNKRGVCC